MRLRAFAALAFLTFAHGLSPALPAQEKGPEETVRAFIEHIEKGNYPAASALVAGSRISGEQGYGFTSGGGQHYTIKAARVYGDDTEAVVVIDLETEMQGQSKTITDTLRLRKTDGVWKIYPTQIFDIVPTPSLFAGMMLPNSVFAQAKEAAKKTACLSNVKQLAIATLMYAADNDDRLPDANKWRASIMPYAKNADIFRCPDDKTGALSSYRMNPLVTRVSQTSMKDPAGTVMIFEGDANGFAPRHASRGNVGFADGHAKAISSAEYPKLRKNR